MRAKVKSMILQTLLRQHGTTTIRELMHRAGLSRQHCWSLWHGYDGMGKATAKRLHETLGIPQTILLINADHRRPYPDDRRLQFTGEPGSEDLLHPEVSR